MYLNSSLYDDAVWQQLLGYTRNNFCIVFSLTTLPQFGLLDDVMEMNEEQDVAYGKSSSAYCFGLLEKWVKYIVTAKLYIIWTHWILNVCEVL